MSDLDLLIAAADVLVANQTAVDRLINLGLLYGPGVTLTAAVVTAWRTGRWAVRRIEQATNNRAIRQHYTARANRLHTVAQRTDAQLAMPHQLINQRLEAQLAAADHAREGEL